MAGLKKLVADMESENMKKLYMESKDIIEEVARFITKKKLMIYGGFALNVLLPEDSRFYKSFTVNDYDCFSKNAKRDAVELTEIFKKKGYKYIKIRNALHENTYKVYVDLKQILDITQMDSKLYDDLYKISEYERKTIIYKHYKEDYKLAPFMFLKANMYFELARPNSSYFRWEKIYNRLSLMSVLTKGIAPRKNMNESKLLVAKPMLDDVMRYIKAEKVPLIGNYALKLYNIKGYNSYDENLIEIISMDTKKTMIGIRDIISRHMGYTLSIRFDSEESPIKHKKHFIYVKNAKNDVVFVVKVVDISNECFSVVSKKGYEVCSIDACLYFLYRDFLSSSIMFNRLDFNNRLWGAIISAEGYTKVFTNNIEKRFSTRCYGKSISLEEVLKDNWKKKMTIKYA